MQAQLPDAETLRTALGLATRAPSICNTQPWKWHVGPPSLELYSDPSVQLASADPQGRELILSCGATLHHCVVALAALGWLAEVHRLPDPTNHTHLATITVRPRPAEQDDIMLAAAIPRRRTDRRYYSSWPVPADNIAALTARATQSGVLLRQIDAPEKLKAIAAQAVLEHTRDASYLQELTKWTGRYNAVAGVPARSTPPSRPADALPGRVFAAPALAQPAGASSTTDNAAVLALGTATDDRSAWLQAGETTSLVLLAATAMGLASCPISEPLEIPATRALIRAAVFGAEAQPQILLRVGWAPINADPLPPTPRREISAVVQWRPSHDAAIPG